MTRSKDVDPTGQFERAQAEVAGISHEAIPPKLDSIEPEAGGLWRKKPVVIEAFRFGIDKPPLWWKGAVDEGKAGVNKFKQAFIHTPEGVMVADNHDWIIRGVKGELYPCKPEIFEATYEAASTAPAPVAVPAGYRLVPEEPTWEMQIAGRDALIDAIDDDNLDTFTDDAKTAYRAMLSTSPVPSTATQAGAVTQHDAVANSVRDAAVAGWNACRKSIYAVCEDVQSEADRLQQSSKPGTDSEEQHAKGYYAGSRYAAKSSARGFCSMNAEDDDNLTAALASSPETARDRAERRVAELHDSGLHTLGDIERAQSSGEPIAFLSKRALAQFDVNGCEIVDARLYPKGTLRPNEEIAVFSRPQADDGWRPTGHVSIAHDGFAGDIIGHYETREGKRGVVVQQDGTRVVHVYGEKWLLPSAPATGGGE